MMVKNQIITNRFVYISNIPSEDNRKYATTFLERSKCRIFLEPKLFGSKHLGKNLNLEQREKFSLIAR